MMSIVGPCELNKMGFYVIDLHSNLIPVRTCIMQFCELQWHTSFRMLFVRALNVMDQMLFCCIVAFQYVSIICQCEGSGKAFAKHRVEYLAISYSPCTHTWLSFPHIEILKAPCCKY